MKRLLLTLCMTAALAACGPSNTPVLDQNGQPTGQSVQGMGAGAGAGALLGGLAGFMLGRSSANSAGVSAQPSTTVIQRRTVIIDRQPAAPAPAPMAKPDVSRYKQAPTFSKPAVPSYSPARTPSFSKPSVSSFRGGRR